MSKFREVIEENAAKPISKTKLVIRPPQDKALQGIALLTRPLQRALVSTAPHPRLFQDIVVITRITLLEKHLNNL